MIAMEIPWPPSVNRYWRQARGRTFLSPAAKSFRKRVWEVWFVQKYVFRRDGFGSSPVSVKLVVRPPDRRHRDIDNVIKATLDALQHAKIIEDDSQVRRLEVEWGESVRGGAVQVAISRATE